MNSQNSEKDESVSSLLIAQIEIADTVLINKCDLISNDALLQEIKQIIQALNPSAKVRDSEYANVPFEDIIIDDENENVVTNTIADLSIIDDHRELVDSIEEGMSSVHEHSHSHDEHSQDHEHSHSHDEHSQDHEHSHSHDVHSQDHEHSHSHDEHS